MTTDEFIAELKQHGIKFGMKGFKSGLIRTKEGDCPICALVKAKGIDTGLIPLSNSWASHLGQELLGLSGSSCFYIMRAADIIESDLEVEELNIKESFKEMVI